MYLPIYQYFWTCEDFKHKIYIIGQHEGMLLVDSGYRCTPHLMTPYLTPSTPAEVRFNSSLCQTRVLIEQTFGIMKRRFAALHFGLRTSPDIAVTYINAIVILHNLGIDFSDVMIDADDMDMDMELNGGHNYEGEGLNDGKIKRREITNRFFSN